MGQLCDGGDVDRDHRQFVRGGRFDERAGGAEPGGQNRQADVESGGFLDERADSSRVGQVDGTTWDRTPWVASMSTAS